MKIEVRYFDGCPNAILMLKTVREVVTSLKKECEYIERMIDTPEMAVKFGFRGSPSLLIDGKDFFGMPVPKDPQLSCRYYPDGIPGKQEILEKIEGK